MRDCKIATISDIHFGSKSNDTSKIIQACRKLLITDGLIPKLDILFFAGDIFDRLLDLDHDNLEEMDLFFADVIHLCEKFGVTLRLLRGTGSHDKDQVERVMTVAKLLKSTVDIKYFNTLDIEYIEKYDAQVLYIPDHWTPTVEETLQQVKDLLKARGLTQVDIAIMHSHFDFQVPKEIKGMIMHDSAEYEKLVKLVIFIGHEHRHSRQGKIFAQGSVDRLSHGQEEPKGMGYCEIVDNQATVWFLENTLARIYKTIDCTGKPLEEAITYVKSIACKLPMDACVRVVTESKHPLLSNMSQLSILFPTMSWTKKGKDEDDEFNTTERGGLLYEDAQDWTAVQIERSNVVDLVMARLQTKPLTQEALEYIEQQLEELK